MSPVKNCALNGLNDAILQLKKLLTDSVKKNPADGLLLSGGLDSAILAAIDPGTKAITVSLLSYGEDIHYSSSIAKFLNIKHFHRSVDVDEAIEAIPEVVKILKSFDPAIPNDLTVYFGTLFAKNLGIDKVATGDGSDEIFWGYSFMRGIRDLEDYSQRVSRTAQFSSNKLGEAFDIDIKQPYLDTEIIKSAEGMPAAFKIRRENGKVWGKWILRKAFEDILPKELIWQDKRPLEYGSGMNRIREIITARISDEEFTEKSRLYPVRFINKEHLYYYEIYRKNVGEIPPAKNGQNRCPACSAGIEGEAFHCGVCGWAKPVN